MLFEDGGVGEVMNRSRVVQVGLDPAWTPSMKKNWLVPADRFLLYEQIKDIFKS